ncbi:MAG: 5-methylthioadenosine phosphorylase, partial [Rubrobacteraceae bacterium]|nr:5-methylthioadenosine phosphorylase [Rubrobacteraceae bacterium]
NYATGVAELEPKEELDRLLTLSARVLPRLVFRTVEMLKEEDLAFDHGYVYRVDGGIG